MKLICIKTIYGQKTLLEKLAKLCLFIHKLYSIDNPALILKLYCVSVKDIATLLPKENLTHHASASIFNPPPKKRILHFDDHTTKKWRITTWFFSMWLKLKQSVKR